MSNKSLNPLNDVKYYVKSEDISKSNKKIFKCSINKCEFEINYDYYGKNPPFCKNISFAEDIYVKKDPFSNKNNIILLGSLCSICKINVCHNTNCSLYVTKRFCRDCLVKNYASMDKEIKKEIDRMIEL